LGIVQAGFVMHRSFTHFIAGSMAALGDGKMLEGI
jgi:hypothetical protein